MTGASRHSLGLLAEELGVQQSKGQNADHYFTFVSYLYAERASQRSAGAWQALMQVIAAGGTQAERNEQTLHILQTQLYLRGLCREQAARLLGCRDRLLYDSTISTFVGEHAMPALRLLLPGGIPETARPSECGHHLRTVANAVSALLPARAVELLEPEAGSFLLDHLPPGIESLSHLQLHEHNACEYTKLNNADRRCKGRHGNPTAEYRAWAHAAYPEHQWS